MDRHSRYHLADPYLLDDDQHDEQANEPLERLLAIRLRLQAKGRLGAKDLAAYFISIYKRCVREDEAE